jgi:thiamine biosynthesis lipoprotein
MSAATLTPASPVGATPGRAGSGTTPGRAQWSAIGTTAVLILTDAAVLAPARGLLASELERIDRAASSYRADSELTHLNARAGTTIAISAALAEAIATACRAAAISGGLVDPTLAGDPGWRAISLTDWSVRLPAGTRLDLGATAKALCADRAARRIAAATGAGVLVSLGGDIAVAGAAPAGGWPIHVSDDHRADPDGPGQRVTICEGALATSSATVRRDRDGRGHHIIDPRRGTPAEVHWRTASVTAATCVDANTAATAAIILGSDAPAWLDRQGLSARLVHRDGSVVTVGGWPEGDPMPAWTEDRESPA